MSNTPLILTERQPPKDDDCACPDTPFITATKLATTSENNDCACANAAMNNSQELNIENRFAQASDTFTLPLSNEFWLACSQQTVYGPCVLNNSAWERWQTFAKPKILREKIDYEFADHHLIQSHNDKIHLLDGEPETLIAWLHISNACSLECPYCYVRKSSERMSEETSFQAITDIFRTACQHNFKKVKLKYAGGEATLHFQLVRKLHAFAVHLSNKTNITLDAVLLSNGVHIKQQDAEWMQANDVKLMISLDGIGEVHNRLRPLRNHTNFDTFRAVENTIDNILLPLDIKPNITMTVTALNANSAADVAKWALIDRDLPTNFNFYRQNPNAATRSDLNLEEEALIEGMLAAYAVIEKYLPERPFLNGLLDRVQTNAHTHTCGVGQNYMVITHTGKLAQCHMHLDHPVSQNLNDPLLNISTGPLHNLSVDQKAGCKDCTFRYRCSGGCPLETYRATGRWDIQSPNCNIYKRLYPEALRLEGLRLLKVNGYLQ
ncbi:SPASM domain-containing protein [candidate division KSB1 bacterium]|nr:SPASM domain-containing protein [candidate division KSB1 bacterium]